MDRLETLIRDTLAEHAADAPGASALTIASSTSSAPRARRRWLAAGLAAAVVAGVAVGVVALRSDSSHRPTAAPPLPAGFKLVSYHGIEIGVPATMPVENGGCGPAQHDQVFAFDGEVWSCPAIIPRQRVPQGLTLVSLEPIGGADASVSALATQQTTVDGSQAKTGFGALPDQPGVTGVVVLPEPGVIVTVTSPSQETSGTILATIRLAAIDRYGCAAQSGALTPTGNASADSLLPGEPISVVGCIYTGDDNLVWLAGSVRLTGRQLSGVVGALQEFNPKVGDRYRSGGLRALLRFQYRDGHTRTIVLTLDTEPAIATDGTHTVTGAAIVLPAQD